MAEPDIRKQIRNRGIRSPIPVPKPTAIGESRFIKQLRLHRFNNPFSRWLRNNPYTSGQIPGTVFHTIRNPDTLFNPLDNLNIGPSDPDKRQRIKDFMHFGPIAEMMRHPLFANQGYNALDPFKHMVYEDGNWRPRNPLPQHVPTTYGSRPLNPLTRYPTSGMPVEGF